MTTLRRITFFSLLLALTVGSIAYAQQKSSTILRAIALSASETELTVYLKPTTIDTSFVISIQEQGKADPQDTKNGTLKVNEAKNFQFVTLKPKTNYDLTIVGTPTDANYQVYRKTFSFNTTSGATGNPDVASLGSTGGNTSPGQQQSTGGNTAPAPTGQITDAPLNIRLKNPLKVNTIQEAIKLFMDAIIKIAIPFIVVFFIWTGLKFILAQGKPEEIKKARQMFWNTVIGTLLILGAWAITDAIVGTVNSLAS